MLYDNYEMLISKRKSECYTGFVLPSACFKSMASINEIVLFLEELKELFNFHSNNETFPIYNAVFDLVQKSEIFSGSEYYVNENKKSIIFSFCHFITQADTRRNLTKKYFIHVSHLSCEFLFPLDPKKAHGITEDFFETLKEAQHIVVKAASFMYR